MKVGMLLYTYSDAEKNKFGLDCFKKNNIDLHLLNCSSYFYKISPLPISTATNIDILSPKHLEEHLAANAYDHILVNFPFTFKTWQFYSILWKRSIRFSVFFIDAWPHGISLDPFSKLKRYFKNLFFSFCLKSFPPIERIFSPVLSYSEIQFMFDRAEEIIAFRSVDCDYLFQKERKIKARDDNYILFLDQYWPFHPDFIALDKATPLEVEYYAKYLNIFFERLEKITKKKIKITLHPKANLEQSKIIYGDREILQGETLELISSASLILGHYSTSLMFALVMEKPVLLIDFNKLAKKHKNYIKNLSSIFFIPQMEVDTVTDKECEKILEKISFYSCPSHLIKKYIAEDLNTHSNYWDYLIEKIFLKPRC